MIITTLLVLPTSYINLPVGSQACVCYSVTLQFQVETIYVFGEITIIFHITLPYSHRRTHTLCSGVVWSGFIWEYSYQHQPALYITIVPVKGNVTLSLQTVPGTTEPLFREPLQNGYCKTRRLCKIRGCRNLTAEELALNAALIKLVLHQDAVRF